MSSAKDRFDGRLVLGLVLLFFMVGIVEFEYSILISAQSPSRHGPILSAVISIVDWLSSRSSESITALATAAIAIFTLTLWWTTRGLLQAAVTSANHTGRSIDLLVADQRPWVSADIRLASGLKKDANGVSLELLFVLKNTGNSPALSVTVLPELYPLIGPEVDPIGHQRAIAERAERAPVGVPMSVTLFPGNPKTMRIMITLTNEQIQRHDEQLKEMGVPDFPFLPSVLILGCIDYRSVLTTRHLQTGFILDLFAFDVAMPVRRGIPRFDAEFPADKLMLGDSVFGSGYTS